MTCDKRFYTLCLSFLIFFLITAASYGDTVTSLGDSGPGSLRDAIANTAPGGTVNFSVSGTISLLTELVIDKDLTIDGPGAGHLTVSGGDVTRIFVISGGTDITISGLRITDGNGVGSILSGGVGGAILLVSANSNVELDDCVFENNTTSGSLGLGIITNLANGISLVVNRCAFTDNSTVVPGTGLASGGVFGTGASEYTIEVNDSTFTRNFAQSNDGLVLGGVVGIAAGDLDFKFNNCTFDSNYARGNALVIGGVFGDGGESNTEFTNCTFYNNRVECNGVNCNAIGGAIGSGGGSHVSCNFCTFDSNTAACTGANCQEIADAVSGSVEGTEISNSIVKGDDPSNNCGTIVGIDVVSLGYNIDNGSSCVDGTVTGDKPNTDPLFNPHGLQDNGGPAKTIALLPASPAIDTADPACPPPFTDERGVTRPQQTACDIGAYELLVQVSNIPTMSEWGLIITAGLLGIAGLMVVRRRKASA